MNSGKTLRSAFGLFAIGFALLFPLQARAQQTKALLNYYTGTALNNGGNNVENIQMFTSIWIPIPSATNQQWQFFRDPGATGNPQRINSANSFKMLDILAHVAMPLFPVVQSTRLLIDNSTPWRFQTWHVNRFLVTPNGMGYYTLKNGGSGMCLTDFGQIGVGGAVVEQACDSNPRQLWAIWNFNFGRWETSLVP